MKKGIFLVVGWLAVSALAEPAFDLNRLHGVTPEILTQFFNGLDSDACKAGESIKVENWRGVDSVYLAFNANRNLASISFSFSEPIPRLTAERILNEKMGVALPATNTFHSSKLAAYRGMPGAIKTVNLHYSNGANTDPRVSEIGIFYNLDWDPLNNSYNTFAERDPNAVKAFGKLFFGDRAGEVESVLRSEKVVELYGLEFSISPDYKNDKLSAVILISKSGSMSDYRDEVLWPAYIRIKEAFVEKYGKPTSERDFEMARLGVPEGHGIVMSLWKKPDRILSIDLYHHKSRRFLISITIEEPSAAKGLGEKEKEKMDELF